MANVGSPLMDMAMLMLSSFSKQDRSEHTKQLLDTYHFTFCSTLARLGVDQIKVFPMFTIDHVIEEYDRFNSFWFCQDSYLLCLGVCLWPSTRPSAS